MRTNARLVLGTTLIAISAMAESGLLSSRLTNVSLFASTGNAESGRPSTGQIPAVPSPTYDGWQTAAGGKQAFDAVSVKRNTSGSPPFGDAPESNVPMGIEAFYNDSSDFSAVNLPLITYIAFAYRLTVYEALSLQPQLPEWAIEERFDIRGRVNGHPGQDQRRLMMQALLADRFKLVVHSETRDLPVFALVPLTPGKIGPQLRPHSNDGCGDCGVAIGAGQSGIISASKATMDVLAILISNSGSVDRAVVDRTEMSGVFDFTLKFVPSVSEPNPMAGYATNKFEPPVLPIPQTVTDTMPDPPGPQPTIFTALREQLGLALEPQTRTGDFLVIDHIEEPAQN